MTLKQLQSSDKTIHITNRSFTYLTPVFRSFDNEFITAINNLDLIAIGINDELFEKTTGLKYDNHLYCLFDVDEGLHGRAGFYDNLLLIREHELYETDYPFDDAKNGKYHMIVIRMPDEYTYAIECFKKSQYSKMYTKRQIKQLFESSSGGKLKHSKAYYVITKNSKYKQVYEEMLNEPTKSQSADKSYVDLPWIEIPEGAELDSKIEPSEEIFNYVEKVNES